MTLTAGARFVIAIATIPAIGAWTLALLPRRCIKSWPVAIVVTALAGWLTIAAEMAVLAVAGVPWTIGALVILPVAGALVTVWRFGRSAEFKNWRWNPCISVGIAMTCCFLVLAAYAALTSRATSTDYLLFWGTKGARFAAARTVDLRFLRDPDHYFMHPDYPPLLPLLYSWGALVAGRFPWGAALVTFPWFIALAVLTYSAGVKRAVSAWVAGMLTACFAGLLALTLVVKTTAGNADPPLILFETVALSIVSFWPPDTVAEWCAGIALAGGAMTKVEGLFFAGLLVIATAVFERTAGQRWRTIYRLAIPPVVAIAGWVIFCIRSQILSTYNGAANGKFIIGHLWTVLTQMGREAGFQVFYLPWVILVLLVILLKPRVTTAACWTGIGYLLVNIWFYLHGTDDPTLWVRWSAGRTLITVLVCGIFAVSVPRLRPQARAEHASPD